MDIDLVGVEGIVTAKPTENQGMTTTTPGDARQLGKVMSKKWVLNSS